MASALHPGVWMPSFHSLNSPTLKLSVSSIKIKCCLSTPPLSWGRWREAPEEYVLPLDYIL